MDKKRQKKILQVITKSNFGGAQKYVYEISTELKNRDCDVLVAFGGEGILKEKLVSKGVKTVSIESLYRDVDITSDIKSAIELFKLIRKEKPDVVHLNSSKIGAVGGLVSRICRVPKIIYTIHGLAFNENRGFFSKIFLKKIYWFSIAMSHYSIAVSKNLKEQLLDIPFFGLLKEKIIVIRNGVKEIQFKSRETSRTFINQKINNPNQSINENVIIGTIAELHHIKGLNYLIEASRKITDKNPEVIFVVFGEGEERENLERLIRENGLTQKFFLLGFVDEASKYMKALDMFVLPSLSEALALVILEAKQANLKIAASKVGGIPEALGSYERSIMFEPKNVQDLSEKIEALLKIDFKDEKEDGGTKEFEDMMKKTVSLYNKN